MARHRSRNEAYGLRASRCAPSPSAAHLAYDTPHRTRALRMDAPIQSQHDLSPSEIDAIEDRIYNHNRGATGRDDARGLGFVIRDATGRTIGVAAGYSWADVSELKQMWVDEAYRGRGYARELLNAFVTEAAHRGVRRIWVASYDFQAPGMYEKAGFKRMAEFVGWPEGHYNIILCKTLIERSDTT
jgi:N-acetylglutamate synthase-like GNAT family acetyltransferase